MISSRGVSLVSTGRPTAMRHVSRIFPFPWLCLNDDEKLMILGFYDEENSLATVHEEVKMMGFLMKIRARTLSTSYFPGLIEAFSRHHSRAGTRCMSLLSSSPILSRDFLMISYRIIVSRIEPCGRV